MDYNIVTLEIADHITHFDYYDRIVSEMAGPDSGHSEEQDNIRNKSKEHLREFFAGAEFFNAANQLLPLSDLSGAITAKIKGMKAKEVHSFIEKLEKDAKRMKKLYKALIKEQNSVQ